tara:strand:+ start:561 stop:851 length:291 start_codon:yes stop_codon:yes gene_type:complete
MATVTEKHALMLHYLDDLVILNIESVISDIKGINYSVVLTGDPKIIHVHFFRKDEEDNPLISATLKWNEGGGFIDTKRNLPFSRGHYKKIVEKKLL